MAFYLQGGLVEAALLGGAQIDRYGNLNSTIIGSYDRPTVRLPGSGGAGEIAIHAGRVLIMLPLARRAFVPRLDFVTSPGHLTGGQVRAQAGLPGGGPQQVITDLALFDFANPDHEMQLVSLHPGVTAEAVQAAVGWSLRRAPTLATTPAPTAAELQFIRGAQPGP